MGRAALHGPHWGVLGQLRRGVVLVDLQNRVLRPPPLGQEIRGQDRLRTRDRGTLQPQTASLLDRHAHPSTLRKAPTSDGTSRLIACPPFGVNLSGISRSGLTVVLGLWLWLSEPGLWLSLSAPGWWLLSSLSAPGLCQRCELTSPTASQCE